MSQNGLDSRGEKSEGNCRVTYSRWTLLTAKATEGNAFCRHGRYFTQLHGEKRAEFKRELGKSQLCCLETVLSFQYIKIKSTQRQENACVEGDRICFQAQINLETAPLTLKFNFPQCQPWSKNREMKRFVMDEALEMDQRVCGNMRVCNSNTQQRLSMRDQALNCTAKDLIIAHIPL